MRRGAGEGPLTRIAAQSDLSPKGEVTLWRGAALFHLSLWGRGRRGAPGEGAFRLGALP